MSQSNNSIFFLSTGRCGTQWLQKTLAAVYSDVAEVVHERIRASSKLYLRSHHKLDELLSSAEIAKQLAFIKETLKSRTYIETGWPAHPAIPLLISELEGKVRIVHLVRHPVYAALSIATHQLYTRRDWVSRFAIDPSDDGVVQKDLQPAWDGMNLYEKCLFWWTEVHLYALEVKERFQHVEFFFLRYEDLFGSDTQVLKDFVEFMGLTYDPALEELRTQVVDRYRSKSAPLDWELILKYPRTIAVAEQFGYDVTAVAASQISNRYFAGNREVAASR